MSIFERPDYLRTVLLVDAATCVATGLVMTLGAGLVSGLTQLPSNLVASAGLSLFPVAAFIAYVATRRPLWTVGAWLVVVGNIAWVMASVLLLIGGSVSPNSLGVAFVIAQAAVVAVLAELEAVGLRRLPAAA